MIKKLVEKVAGTQRSRSWKPQSELSPTASKSLYEVLDERMLRNAHYDMKEDFEKVNFQA